MSRAALMLFADVLGLGGAVAFLWGLSRLSGPAALMVAGLAALSLAAFILLTAKRSE